MPTQDWKGTVKGVIIDSVTIGPFTKNAAGEVTNPTQPAFLAFNSGIDADVTGDGTAAVVDFDTEVFDQGDNFAADIFTAPVTGKYPFSVAVALVELATGHTTLYINLVTSNRTVRLATKVYASANPLTTDTLVGSVEVDMDAGDTAFVRAIVSGSTRVVDISGHATVLLTYFSGFLVC